MAQLQEVSQVSAVVLPTAVSPNSVAATELRPWGSFTILEEGRGYKIKRIEVKPGHRLSLQMHHHRSEHWIVVSGTARVTCGDAEIMLGSNQSTYVPQCTNHRLENPGVIPLVLIEVQNGEYLGEDDIVRFQDDYARTKK
jgi:mannose-6-phosphate isomerase